MSSDTRIERVRAIVDRVARSYDLEIFDVQLRREAPGWVLRVVIDRPLRRNDQGEVVVEPLDAGIRIDECERVSQDVSAILDVEDVVEHAFTLEVSSPGLDRPLRHADDYRRFAGRLAKLVVPEGVAGQTHFEGRLKGVENEAVVVQVGRRDVRIPLPGIARGRLEVEF